MDEYNQVGPEKPMYEGDVIAVAKKLARRGVVDVKFAARGTMKHVVLVLMPTKGEQHIIDEAIFYGTQRPDGFATQPGIFVGLDGGLAAWLPATGDLHPSYVQGYLGTSFGAEADGSDALTDFINGVARYLYGAAVAGGLAR